MPDQQPPDWSATTRHRNWDAYEVIARAPDGTIHRLVADHPRREITFPAFRAKMLAGEINEGRIGKLTGTNYELEPLPPPAPGRPL